MTLKEGFRRLACTALILGVAAQTFGQSAPVVTTQPTNQTVLAGAAATFNVAVSGPGPFTYHWRLNGTNIPNLITTIAGTGVDGYFGDGGFATNAGLYQPAGLAVDLAGNVFIADES